uniref:Arf-GAP domain-containing protein n=1 Tax=Chromera velia CCMP2878 TaxID=1169474 RepID=A0A0G4GLJ4_9ALVE|eukprot:Cvel_22421.t1-p1 / transcript=Cvel_22421.t1 / gene=Cvel_22421 / organism=Chromera_velia_CCMP2878 / gene_product=hypothetical protein / transcript_product=hypothetical protein / location=Cvel_scaffold2200:30549-31562(+) / protein_length=100 / sequence_SO=supercontig / SO=protein_coding / is_pseudo=false
MAEFGLSEQDLKDAQHLEKLYSFMKDNKNCAKCSSKGVTHINPSSGELVCGSCAPGVSGKRVGDTRFSDSEFAKIEKRYGKKGGSKEKPKAEKKKKVRSC